MPWPMSCISHMSAVYYFTSIVLKLLDINKVCYVISSDVSQKLQNLRQSETNPSVMTHYSPLPFMLQQLSKTFGIWKDCKVCMSARQVLFVLAIMFMVHLKFLYFISDTKSYRPTPFDLWDDIDVYMSV